MSYLGYGIVCLLLLLFVRSTMEKLYPIVQILIFFLFFAQIYRHVLKPIFTELATSFSAIPYSHSLVYTTFLLLMNQFVQALLETHEEEAIGQAVTIAVRASIVWMWFVQLRPVMTQMTALLQKLS